MAQQTNNPSISSTIDRLIGSTSSSSSTTSAFIPSSTWQGSREGYVFRKSDQGIGYYLDNNNNDDVKQRVAGNNNRKRSRSSSFSNTNGGGDGGDTARSVRFGSNSIQTIPSRQGNTASLSSSSSVVGTSKTADELLEEAEQSLASQLHPRKTLSLGTTPQNQSTKQNQNQTSNNSNQQQLKSHILTLEKNITKNQFLRARHPHTPEKFMESELALHEDINSLQDMAASIGHYEEFVSLGGVDSLVGLLGHENVDVSLVVAGLFVELLDPALVGSSGINDDEEEGNGSTAESNERLGLKKDGVLVGKVALAFLGKGAMAIQQSSTPNGGLEMCIANLHRLDESQEEELKGLDDVLTLVENLMDLDRMGVFQLVVKNNTEDKVDNDDDSDAKPSSRKYQYRSIASILMTCTTLTSYLLSKLGQKKLDHWTMTLRLHASEVLTSIIQHEDSRIYLPNFAALPPYTSMFDDNENDDDNSNKRKKKKVGPLDGMEALLQSIALYRKKDPTTEEECEYLINMFDALAASLLHNDTNIITPHNTPDKNNNNNNKNVTAFLERQGVELMIRCITEKVHSGSGAIKVLFFAVSSNDASSNRVAELLVAAGGLKTIFPIFMGRKSSIPKPALCCDAGNVGLLKKYTKRVSSGEGEEKKLGKTTKRVVAANREWFRGMESHSIQIVYGLTRYLTDRSPHDAKARLLAKFVEFDCEKCDRLVELVAKYDIKMRNAEYQYYKSDEAEEAEELGVDVDLAAVNFKLSRGGDLFHRVGAIVAFVAVGSKRCHEYILEQLRTQDSGIGVVKAALEEFASLLGDSEQRRQLCKYLDAI